MRVWSLDIDHEKGVEIMSLGKMAINDDLENEVVNDNPRTGS